MDNYVLGIFWAIGRYSVDNGIKYFFIRHKERYYLDVVRQELGLKSSVFFAEHKGKPQYKLKVTGFDFARIEKLGWQPRFSEQRDYPKIYEHRDFLRAYIEIHSRIDILTITSRGRKQRQPRLRIYGSKYFLSELTEVLSAEVGALPKKVQKATNKSEVSGILYYTSRAEIECIVSYLYQPETKYFNRERYEEFRDILIQFQK